MTLTSFESMNSITHSALAEQMNNAAEENREQTKRILAENEVWLLEAWFK